MRLVKPRRKKKPGRRRPGSVEHREYAAYLKLLEECAELRRTLQTISAQVGRMENRLKRAFPAAATRARERKSGSKHSNKASITPEQALANLTVWSDWPPRVLTKRPKDFSKRNRRPISSS
jgi:hypothetical protein